MSGRNSSLQIFIYQIELLLQLLVGIVDAKLLEAVDVKGLKAVDVKDTNEAVGLAAGPEGLVDVQHDPVEEVGVDALGQGITSEESL